MKRRNTAGVPKSRSYCNKNLKILEKVYFILIFCYGRPSVFMKVKISSPTTKGKDHPDLCCSAATL